MGPREKQRVQFSTSCVGGAPGVATASRLVGAFYFKSRCLLVTRQRASPHPCVLSLGVPGGHCDRFYIEDTAFPPRAGGCQVPLGVLTAVVTGHGWVARCVGIRSSLGGGVTTDMFLGCLDASVWLFGIPVI